MFPWGPQTALDELLKAKGSHLLAKEIQEDIEKRRSAEAERQRLETLPPLYVIHTIHGTFARGADWVEPKSRFCLYLREHLGWRAKIEPFRWSGRNNPFARWAWAQKFKNHLVEKLKQKDYTGARHFIVAHSHGGNVAFMAINSPDLAAHIRGVVTLATPFLTASVRRASDELIDPGVGFFVGLFAGWAVMFWGLSQGAGWTWWPWALAAVVGTIGLLFLGHWIQKLMRHHAERIDAWMPDTSLSPEQVAVIRVQGDEATAAIAGARLAGTLADLVWRVATARVFDILKALLTKLDYGGFRSLQEKLEAGTKVILDTLPSGRTLTHRLFSPDLMKADTAESPLQMASQMSFQIIAIVMMQVLSEGSPTERFWAMVLLGLYGIPAALAVTTVALGIPFAIISSLSLLPIGLTVPLAGPYLDLTAETSPPGSWTVTHFRSDRETTGLFHSAAYQNWDVLAFLAQWIKVRVPVESDGGNL
jgi:hypothetical protein